jgi:hypothetical protein
MDKQLLPNDCLLEISKYLDNKDKYSLLTSSKSLYKYLPQYYISNIEVDYDKIDKIDPKYYPFIKYLKNIKSLKELHRFSSLQKIRINDNNFNESLDNLPKTLHSLKIYSFLFNQPLNNLPKHIEYISVNGYVSKSCNKYTNL